jgi:hypothetical protein
MKPQHRILSILAALALLGAACRVGSPTAQPTAPAPTQAGGDTPTPGATNAPEPTATAAEAPVYVAALLAALAACPDVARNHVCYGGGAVTLTPQPGAEAQPFAQPGDVADLAALAALALGGDPVNWGIAVLSLEAGLADEAENLTAVAFGPAELIFLAVGVEEEGLEWTIAPGTPEEAEAADLPDPATFEPLQRLRLSSSAPAAEGYPVGLLLWTPWEGGAATIELNGAIVQLGSTAYAQANPAQGLTLAVLEGAAAVTAGNTAGIVPPGGQGTVALDAEGAATAPVSEPEIMDPRARAISEAVAQYGIVPPDPRAEAISAAVAQYGQELPDPWMDRVLVRAYAGWLERAARLCTTLGGARGARYVYNVLYWDRVLDRMGSDDFIDSVLGVGARARLDDAARRCLTFELDFGSLAEAQASQLAYTIELEAEGVPLHFAPTGLLERAENATITHVQYDVVGEETRCPSELITENGELRINGVWLRIKVNSLIVGADFMAEVPRELVRYHCPLGPLDVPLSWQPIFGGAYGELAVPETGSVRFADWRVSQGEHFAETIQERTLPVDGADVTITTYLVLTHTPIRAP